MCGFVSELFILFHWSMYLFFLPVSYCLLDSFVGEFEIRKSEASSFVLLPQDCFGYSGSFVVSFVCSRRASGWAPWWGRAAGCVPWSGGATSRAPQSPLVRWGCRLCLLAV